MTPVIAPERLEGERRFLYGLGYRLTGSTADAEDIVQDTFARVRAHPPPDLARPLRPYLVRIAVNLGRDRYRRRRRAPYVGPWLPWPLAGEGDGGTEHAELEPRASTEDGPEERYSAHESVRFAFLLALEALSPNERAVLVLRDVLDYSVRETAEALGLKEPHVKTLHLRARRAIQGHPTAAPRARAKEHTDAALFQFLEALSSGDAARIEGLLASEVKLRSDGGGHFKAALRVVQGPAKVTRFFLKLGAKFGPTSTVTPLTVNGQLAVLIEHEERAPPAVGMKRSGIAPRTLLMLDLDGDGRVRDVHLVLAPEKLDRLLGPRP
jgi:RNA polymerase sigma-70 factor (ECF subfamily)